MSSASFRFLAAFVLAVPFFASASAQSVQPVPTNSPPAAAVPKDNAALAPATPSLPIKCVFVRDRGIARNVFGEDESSSDPLRTGGSAADKDCAKLKVEDAKSVLTGAGDLLIVVDKAAFLLAQEARREQAGQFLLFLNGVALLHDASLVASEHVDNFTVVRYRLSQGAELQRLWSMLYADRGLFELQPLHAALGWQPAAGSDATQIPVRSSAVVQVRITTVARLWLAIVLVSLVVAMTVFLGRSTDTLRDADTPSWWAQAVALRRRLGRMRTPTERDAYLRTKYPDVYDTDSHPRYDQLAESALAGDPIGEADVVAATIGLAMRTENWKPRMASYSLSRTQLALWFAFTVATGLFLWLLYGDLRRIDGSLLVLLSISVGTAGVSWASDRSADGRPYLPSKGFWFDLLTGFDERKQVHRYQAVVVNILLLVVGIDHVAQQLSYPVFDPTWLIFLGISGSAYGIGKQMLESK
jgi:hypothetical protein